MIAFERVCKAVVGGRLQCARMTERFIDIKEVTRIVLYKRGAIYKFVSEGTFPKPTKLGPRKVGWSVRRHINWNRLAPDLTECRAHLD